MASSSVAPAQSTAKVRVAVRIRPETRVGRKCAVANPNHVISVGDKTFNFDAVYDEDSTQSEVYEGCVAPLVLGCFKGYNATLFACEYMILRYESNMICRTLQ